MRITHGKIIPRDDGKRIEELVGAATTGTRSVSVAKMRAPPGWVEPPQTPRFDEVVMVLAGRLTLELDGKRERIAAGETGLVQKGKRVIYRNEENASCEYFSVCSPAFLPELANVESPAPVHRVAVLASHPRAGPLVSKVQAFAERCLESLDLDDVELSISLVGDRAIKKLNRTWRKTDHATDVLSFPGGGKPRGAPGPTLLGDVVISLDTAERRAKEDRRPVDAEVSRYLAHGVLHLIGHDHHRPRQARKMAKLERKLLGREGMLGSPTVGRL